MNVFYFRLAWCVHSHKLQVANDVSISHSAWICFTCANIQTTWLVWKFFDLLVRLCSPVQLGEHQHSNIPTSGSCEVHFRLDHLASEVGRLIGFQPQLGRLQGWVRHSRWKLLDRSGTNAPDDIHHTIQTEDRIPGGLQQSVVLGRIWHVPDRQRSFEVCTTRDWIRWWCWGFPDVHGKFRNLVSQHDEIFYERRRQWPRSISRLRSQ